VKRVSRIALLAVALLAGYWLFAPDEWSLSNICSADTRINTPGEAIAFAKQQIAGRTGVLEGTSFRTTDEYIAAMERNPRCCSASYGDRSYEGAGRGWSVSLWALDRKPEYQHEVEFNACGSVTYNGGMSY
jgi:hypothetical protein